MRSSAGTVRRQRVDLCELSPRLRACVLRCDGVEIHGFRRAEAERSSASAGGGGRLRTRRTTIEPSQERNSGGISKLRHTLVRAQVCVVHYVLHVTRVALDPHGDVERERRMPAVERLERRRCARLEPERRAPRRRAPRVGPSSRRRGAETFPSLRRDAAVAVRGLAAISFDR